MSLRLGFLSRSFARARKLALLSEPGNVVPSSFKKDSKVPAERPRYDDMPDRQASA